MSIPNIISIVRIALTPVFVVFYIKGELYPALGVLLLCGLSDVVDGAIARKYNMVTDLGKFLDPIADKILVIVGLAFVVDGRYFDAIGVPYVAMICSIIIVAREFIIGLLRQIAALKSFVIAADKMGKLKTIATLSALTTLLFSPLHVVITWIGFVELLIATILTVVSGAHYIYKNRGVFIQEEKKEEGKETNKDQGAGGEFAQGADKEEG